MFSVVPTTRNSSTTHRSRRTTREKWTVTWFWSCAVAYLSVAVVRSRRILNSLIRGGPNKNLVGPRINMFKRTFSSKNCVFTGKHDQKCRRSSDSELYCNFSSFCSLEGTKSIKKESKYMISNTLRLSRQHCNLKGRNLPKRSNTTADIADKVILSKEISKSVKCFKKKTQTFRVYDNLEFYIVAYK